MTVTFTTAPLRRTVASLWETGSQASNAACAERNRYSIQPAVILHSTMVKVVDAVRFLHFDYSLSALRKADLWQTGDTKTRVLTVRDCVPSLQRMRTFQPATFITSLCTRTVVAFWFITGPADQKTSASGTHAADALALFVISLFMLLIEEDTLGFDWGRGPKSYLEKRSVCPRFSTDALTERPEVAGCQNRHLLDFHQCPFSLAAVLIPLGGYQINLPWMALPGTEVPDGIALALPVATALPCWGRVGL